MLSQVAPVFAGLAFSAALYGQAAISGRVVDETGAGVSGARVEIRAGAGEAPAAVSSDLAGNFAVTLPGAGEYDIVTQRQGFFQFHGRAQRFEAGPNQLTITLHHVQEFSESIDVVYSPPAIDPQQVGERKELGNAELLAVPHSNPHDYRASLPLLDGVIQDNAGRLHFNGAETNQTAYSLDGFNIADPVTGRLEARVNLETIQSVDFDTRFSADSGRGSAGALDIKTKMGDDRFRFMGTNFIPGVGSAGGLHLDKWTPRLEVSGPIARGRAWFHNGFDAFYALDTIHGLPNGQNRTRSLTTSDLTRLQVNLSPANILSLSFLFNLSYRGRGGLSVINPVETTRDDRQAVTMAALRDLHYFGGGALVELGFADTRGVLRDTPQGNRIYQITPLGNRGNYFAATDRHSRRQQWIANLFLPTVHFHGSHQLKFGIDFERESFHQTTMRHEYDVLRADNTVARRVTFAGSPFEASSNFEGAQYFEDRWSPVEGFSLEAGLRAEWNQVVRELELAPRLGAAWAPHWLRGTKFSAGWGVYHDSINLGMIAAQQDQISLSTFFLPGGGERGPLTTAFRVDERMLATPRSFTGGFTVERKLPREFYLKAGYTRRVSDRGFTFAAAQVPAGDVTLYQLANARRSLYDAWDVAVRHTFARRFEWFAGYTRSSSRSNAAVEYSLENPIFGAQAPGPYPWDSPNRFHMWGWVPVTGRILPRFLRFAVRETSAAYLVEYRTGFPFSAVDEEGFLAGRPNGRRFPAYFSLNLAFERKFRAIHYLWAWRFGFDNLTNNKNPNVVNNVTGTPAFLTYGRGQPRAFTVRLRLLGRK